MRLHIVRGFLMGSTIAVAVGGHGCSSPCNDTATCAPPGATTSSSMTSSGPGGGGGGMPVGCDPAANMSPVADSCGVFVSSSKGDDGGDGTKAKPYKTITKALGAKKNVYLCGEKFSEAVALTAGTNIFGALKCSSDWSYDASTKSGISGPAGAIPLKISGMGTSTVQDVAVTAADAMMPGDSSIAALVDGSTVTFARVGLTAGKAADGAVGDTPMGTGQDGTKGPDGKKGCIDTMTVFPDPATATNDCGGGESSTGGLGGAGNAGTNGQAGGDGGATPVINNPNGGAGQLAAGGDCKKGDVGKDGAPGTPGDGAKGPGSLSAAGYAGVSGGEGKSAGKPGQGGGGAVAPAASKRAATKPMPARRAQEAARAVAVARRAKAAPLEAARSRLSA